MLEFRDVIGVDEAGRGPLLGPVVASAVYIENIEDEIFSLINDSKKLSEKKRKYIYEKIQNMPSVKFSVGVAGVDEIDKINILNATFLAMNRAIEKLEIRDKIVLVDGNKTIKNYQGKQECLVKGDSKNISIALASIIAKVYRDELICQYAKEYKEYDLENNKGYGTKKHYEAIKKYGILDIHRKTFLKKIKD